MQMRGLVLLRRSLVISALVSSLLLAGCLGTLSVQQPTSPLPTAASHSAGVERKAVQSSRFESLYLNLTFEEMTDGATAIFVGRITKISVPQWNQDSGEDWRQWQTDQAALPIRYLEVEIIKPVIETEELELPLQITTLADEVMLDEKGNIVAEGESRLGLQTGDQAVFFVRQTKIAWRDGARPAIMLIGAPEQSYFKLQDDGLYHGWQIDGPIEERTFTQEALDLETLAKRILAARATPPETP